jgi:hypothetical protein
LLRPDSHVHDVDASDGELVVHADAEDR